MRPLGIDFVFKFERLEFVVRFKLCAQDMLRGGGRP